MSDHDRLAALEAEVARLRDRQEINDCIARAARGTDRHDEALLLSAYHDDASDEHGTSLEPMPEFAASVNARHAEFTRIHTHNLSTHNCEIEGDAADAETYVLAGLATDDGEAVQLCGARYLDRLERRGGEWRIAFRRVVIDWIMAGDASPFDDPDYQQLGFPTGSWGRDDPSYARPYSR